MRTTAVEINDTNSVAKWPTPTEKGMPRTPFFSLGQLVDRIGDCQLPLLLSLMQDSIECKQRTPARRERSPHPFYSWHSHTLDRLDDRETTEHTSLHCSHCLSKPSRTKRKPEQKVCKQKACEKEQTNVNYEWDVELRECQGRMEKESEWKTVMNGTSGDAKDISHTLETMLWRRVRFACVCESNDDAAAWCRSVLQLLNLNVKEVQGIIREKRERERQPAAFTAT